MPKAQSALQQGLMLTAHTRENELQGQNGRNRRDTRLVVKQCQERRDGDTQCGDHHASGEAEEKQGRCLFFRYRGRLQRPFGETQIADYEQDCDQRQCHRHKAEVGGRQQTRQDRKCDELTENRETPSRQIQGGGFPCPAIQVFRI